MIGAFTTFSTLMVTTGRQSLFDGFLIIFINLLGGLICAGLGYWLGGRHVIGG